MDRSTKHSCRVLMSVMLAFIMVFTASVTVMPKTYAAGSSAIAVDDFIDIGNGNAEGYTGVPHWRVIGKGSDGSLLLLSEYLWRGDGSNERAGVAFINGQYFKPDGQGDFIGTDAEAWCNAFEAAVLGGVKGLTVKGSRVEDGEYNYKALHFRAALPALTPDNHVFFLSAEEAVYYLGTSGARRASLPGVSGNSEWYLRSTEVSQGHNFATYVDNSGELQTANALEQKYARPVFWAKFDAGTSFIYTTDEDGVKTWTIGYDPADDRKKSVKTVTVNRGTVNAAAIRSAITAAGGSEKYVNKIILGKSVRRISKGTLKKYPNISALEIKSKKLKKKYVKGSLKGSKVKTIKISVSSKKKTNRKYVKRYRKIFTKKNAGRKVKIK